MIARRARGWTFEANLWVKAKAQVAWTSVEGGRRAWRLRLEYRSARATAVHRAAWTREVPLLTNGILRICELLLDIVIFCFSVQAP